MASGCDSCHGGVGATATITASPASFMPGADVTLSVAINRTSGTTTVGGIFVAAPSVGSLYTISGEGLTLSSNNLIHSAPKSAQNGVVTFRFGYRAPATPGALNLDVFVLSANGDGRPTGDVAGNAAFRAAFGCTPRQYFYDGDGDGFGRTDVPSVLGCDGQAPVNTSPLSTDCDDNDQAIFPGAAEICNTKDDDCDGQVDEGSTPTNLYPDDDGDGFYGPNPVGPAVVGCGLRGYAARGGDCAPKDPKIFPGATELCNLLDDNCDGRADERVRPRCGVGRCVRESVTCDAADCTPGAPLSETCNLLDDDCDGEVDEGDLCPAGQSCTLGACSGAGATTGGNSSTGGTTSASGNPNVAGQIGETRGGAATQGGAVSTGGASTGGAVSAGGTASGAGNSGDSGNSAGVSAPAPAAESGGCRAVRGRPDPFGLGAALLPFALFGLARRKTARRPSQR